ncbi:transglutaminase family protein [Gemmata sp. G18]|uniref:Transglutaminase family protein n=1 Tax=Gemmata palustris TaxID=2822762 RepID=A0ABS5BJR1_9BACT|nr:transglutaminase family protein [Gemmata palustris]MBP3953943.1 transglutaminase family protein [Gemmata palustris]
MGIRVALHHVTKYTYDRPVTLLPHVVRLRPAPHARTPVPSYSLSIEPTPHFLNWQQDPYSNYLARLVFPDPVSELVVTVDLIADLTPINPFDFFIEEYAQEYPFQYDAALARELVPYLETLPAGPLLQKLIDGARQSGVKMNDYLVGLNRLVQQQVSYVIRLEPGVQAPEETLELGRGSCRDSAWLLVQLARHLGLAARFVSGYLIQLVADEKPLEGPEGPTADFTDLHAWAEVYLPGAGWVGLDPTSGLMTAEGHIPLACTADPQSAAPVTGSFSWTKRDEDDEVVEGFDFHMSIARIDETPRVTKPYSEPQWDAINALGTRIDADLREWDVRLTMGGEPTFVSIDDRDAPEWNIAALGPQKRRQGVTLLKRLRDKFAPGALLHFGQGKWYPGEQLPRWAFGCYWRTDGQPIWVDPLLIADEGRSYGFGADDAARFATALAEKLGVDPKYAIPGYEDAWYYLWRERRLPTNVDPLNNKLDSPEDRERLAKVFEQKLGSTVGTVLPLRRAFGAGSPWESGPWALRSKHLFLIPGDSPMGYRLPLDSLPWETPADRQFLEERDPFAPRGPLPGHPIGPAVPAGLARTAPDSLLDVWGRPTDSQNGRARRPLGSALPPSNGTAHSSVPNNVVRTALCIEPRNGKLHVFMPPARFIEDYLDLVAAIESTAAELDRPVLIEGYKPPHDHRVNNFSITPDPGVIEANMHPASSWDELVHITTTLYEEARQSRLCTEKFMLDGRHTGTGGGNHVVIGGPTPADSPILRRPDLLKSLVGFWHNHPSLSYLFSGLFVGPTSQHPRVDEARHDALRELEIAFGQVRAGGSPPAWLVDRLFRNLLTDLTGNTHRAEFCIDKLFSPDSAEGRRGLLELRSFEMPPHARMSCAQLLLMRSLVAWFWRKPYEHKLVRWGTALHDKFMLPHFVNEDFNDVLDELRAHGGYPLDPAWFTPHVEFRFPVLGTVTSRGVNLELRTAIEPWHVLGEESSAGGASRYVDSSVERVQVKVRGLTDPRHVLTCNGRRVPLHPTGTNGEFVAGVRYRAWQPPSCLHPTIPVHAPLVFDVLDTWNDRSVGGCTYHVSHPGGMAPEDFPVNALAAESRRIARFFAFGHTPGPVSVPPEEPDPEFPFTLDLRRPELPQYRAPAPVKESAVFGRVPVSEVE